jgi:mono/diheme cytochrome c family protein
MTNQWTLSLLLGLIATPAPAALLLGDAGRGAKLHADNCEGCHDTGLYTRTNRRVKSVEGLMAQVDMCNGNLRRGLSKQQRDDLVKFLNDTYYKFK